MSSTHSISLWDSSADEPDYQNPLQSSQTTDVAIIGGGFTGLSSALHCAQKGLNAVVLEAEQIGYGGSGRNCGLVNAALWLPPQTVREKLGSTYGPRFITEFGRGPSYVFSLIEEFNIQCEPTMTGTIHAAHSPAGLRELQGRADEWKRLGEPVDLIDAQEVQALTGTDVCHGGLLDHRAGTINPMGYCRGLARAARETGAQIFTKARATKLSRRGDLWQVETPTGTVTAKYVVLGTNAYTDQLWPKLKQVFTPIQYFQLATKPLDERAAHILPKRHGLWNTAPIMFNFRRDRFDRLVVGSMGSVLGSAERGLSHRWAAKQLARLFPSLGPVEFEQAWHGQIAMTPDHLPRIYELDENVFTAIGYNGRGITTGTIFGKSMSELVSGPGPSKFAVTDVDAQDGTQCAGDVAVVSNCIYQQSGLEESVIMRSAPRKEQSSRR